MNEGCRHRIAPMPVETRQHSKNGAPPDQWRRSFVANATSVPEG